MRRLLLIVPALLVVAGCGGSQPSDLMSVLDASPSERDALPTVEGRTVPEDVVADSARYLGETNVARYWVALDGDDQVCIVQAVGEGQEPAVVGSSCAPPDRFADEGVWGEVSAGGAAAKGLIVPDGFDLADAPMGEDWVMVGDNLAAPADQVDAKS